MKTRSLATVAIVLLILVVGVALLYAVRSQVPATVVSSTASASPAASPSNSPSPSASPALAPTQAAPSPASPSATAAPGLCSNLRMTTQAVIERYFELSTSKDPRAVSDCFAAPYREHFVKNPTWDEVTTMWASAGPAAGLQIRRMGDNGRGCDLFEVTVQMPNQRVAPFFSVGPEGGTPRIFEMGSALVNNQIASTTCK
jgi:hypothetical protein